MQETVGATRAYPAIDHGALSAALKESSGIDPGTLAGLDIGLLICLMNLGTPRQRICSALCLSYSELDFISRFLRSPLR